MSGTVTRIPSPTVEVGAKGRQKRDVLAGQFMVTPREPIALGNEILTPGRSRLAPDHRAVIAAPHLFLPADPKDLATASYHRRTLQRELRRRGKAPRANGRSTRQRLSTCGSPRRKWRLP